MLLITTSHRPSNKTRRFCNSLKILPYSYRKNRGSSSLTDLLDDSFNNGFSRIIIVNTRYGNPSELLFFKNKKQISFKFVILGTRMREQSITKNRTLRFTTISVFSENNLESEYIESVKGFLTGDIRLSKRKENVSDDGTLDIRFSKVGTETLIEFFNSKNKELLLPTIRGFFKVV